MSHQLFLSHDSRDRFKAEILARAIQRMSLAQVSVWHSSDNSATGGLLPGHVWLDEIRSRLSSSKAVVALLTPSSIQRPWLLFESGFGAAQENCDLIPVCVGIDSATAIPFPLAMYQTYLLSDYESLKRFAEKLLKKYDIHFDEEMVRPVLLEAVKQLSQALPDASPQHKNSKDITILQAVEDIKEHVDKRLISLLSGDQTSSNTSKRPWSFNISIELNLKKKKTSTQFLEITPGMSVQDVLDLIYFMLEGEVEPRKYLEQWLLRDLSARQHLIVREIQSRIPADCIFIPSSKWEVIRLTKPYTATDILDSFPSRK